MERLAVFGGSFNPVHNGHIYLIDRIDEKLSFDRIFVVPSKIPPHKSAFEMANEYHRLNLCRLSFENNKKVIVSDFEISNAGKSYTVFTIRHFKKQFPKAELFLVVGSDMLLSFHEWFMCDEILSMCTIAAASRCDADSVKIAAYSEKISRLGGSCEIIPVKPLEISSTEIRRRISAGEDTACFMPEKAVQYIKANNLYI
jgi:nicotinate-nucleotide adenylyltransferase